METRSRKKAASQPESNTRVAGRGKQAKRRKPDPPPTEPPARRHRESQSGENQVDPSAAAGADQVDVSADRAGTAAQADGHRSVATAARVEVTQAAVAKEESREMPNDASPDAEQVCPLACMCAREGLRAGTL